MHADIPTMMLMILVTCSGMALAVLVVAEHQPRRDGLGWWGRGLLSNSLSFALFGLAGQAKTVWFLVPGNVMLSAAFACAILAVARFQHLRLPRGVVWWPVVAVGLVSLLFAHTSRWRVPLVDAVLVLQCGAMIRAARAPGPEGQASALESGRRLLLAGLGIMIVIYAYRVVAALAGEAAAFELFRADWTQTVSYMGGLVGIIFTTLGYILMHKERAEANQAHLAMVDALTAIPNRRAIMEALSQTVSQAARARQPLAVMMIDIDRFKRINDQYGHQSGDEVLVEIARRLQGRIREQDRVGRYGGEEFIILSPNTAAEGAMVLAQELRRACESPPMLCQGQPVTVTVSIGLTARVPRDDKAEFDHFVAEADAALYAAKENGRNRVELAPV